MAGSGKYDRRIVLQRATTAEDAAGQPIETFSLLKEVWAKHRAISDGERLQGGGVMSSVNARFLIRWSEAIRDLDTRDRVIYDGRTYDIAGVKEIGRKKEFEITAAARTERV